MNGLTSNTKIFKKISDIKKKMEYIQKETQNYVSLQRALRQQEILKNRNQVPQYSNIS